MKKVNEKILKEAIRNLILMNQAMLKMIRHLEWQLNENQNSKF